MTRAAELFQPIHGRTAGVDGWVSLEVSPLLAHDAARTVDAAQELFIKIPGTREGLGAVEETIFAGVPVNVTLLFSREQYLAAAEAFLRGIERRIDAGRDPNVGSVASVFVSRWDAAVAGAVPEPLRNQLGSEARVPELREAVRLSLASYDAGVSTCLDVRCGAAALPHGGAARRDAARSAARGREPLQGARRGWQMPAEQAATIG